MHQEAAPERSPKAETTYSAQHHDGRIRTTRYGFGDDGGHHASMGTTVATGQLRNLDRARTPIQQGEHESDKPRNQCDKTDFRQHFTLLPVHKENCLDTGSVRRRSIDCPQSLLLLLVRTLTANNPANIVHSDDIRRVAIHFSANSDARIRRPFSHRLEKMLDPGGRSHLGQTALVRARRPECLP